MKKIINVIIIIFIIVGICLVEQILAQQYFKELNIKTSYLQSILSTTEDLNTNDVPYYTDDLFTYWDEKENILCTFINHKEFDDIGIEIDKLKTSISNNDKAKYLESLNLIKHFVTSYKHIFGINLQNIF